MTELPRASSTPLDQATEALGERIDALSGAFARARWLPWVSLGAVVTLAAVFNLWSLSHNGYGNTFYAAAVRSMTVSWKNFFFGAFDPGGFITVDKPPVFLWFGALAARIFGYSSWTILAPSAVAGIASVALIWVIVRRYFGVLAATIAGAALALTPISVAVNRLNEPEPFYILALIGAAFAVLRSLDSRRWWAWTLLAGVLVGIAFNTKMLAAWIPGPALALALVVGDGNSWRANVRRILGRLAVLAIATFVVSASWMLIVDAWPASSRPYIGGSTNNTVSNLAFDYNGFGRVEGEGFGGGPGGRPNGGVRTFTRPNGGSNGGFPFRNGQGGNPGGVGGFGGGNFGGSPPGGNGGFPGGNFGGNPPGGNAAGPAGGGNPTGAGGIIAGSPGWLRMFDAANGGQIGWLLPFALLGGALSAWYWRRDRTKRAAVLLFAGWVVLVAGVFSFAQGIYHSYYTYALAPGIAALTGMTVIAAAGLIRQNRWWMAVVAGIVTLTLAVQFDIAGRFPGFEMASHPWAIALAFAGGAAVVASSFLVRHVRPTLAMSVVALGLMVIPASWSTFEMANASTNATLPQAGPRQGAAGRTFGSAAFDDGTASLAAWLNAHRQAGTRWDLAVSSSQNASTLIAKYNLSVMAIGGFSGSDPTITASQFADMVARGEIRYVLVSGGFGPGGFGARPGFGQLPGGNWLQPGSGPATGSGANGVPSFGTTRNGGAPVAAPSGTETKGSRAVMSAVESACKAVSDSTLPAQYQGSLYDCAGAANAIRSAGS